MASNPRMEKNVSMPSAEALRRAHLEIEQAMRDLRAKNAVKPASRVSVGSEVIVGLRGGGRVAGILARRISNGVVIESDEGANVIILDGASSATRVLAKE